MFEIGDARARSVLEALGFRTGSAIFQAPIELFIERARDWKNPLAGWELPIRMGYFPDMHCPNMPDDCYVAMRIPQLHEMALRAKALGADTVTCL